MTQKLKSDNKLLVKDVNPYLTCPLCDGYLIDATKLVDCLHTFCKGCILKNFENKMCPICNTDYKKKTQCFRSDHQLQTLIYKLVPSLYNKEIQSKKEFYRSTTVRASSSCSDDSVIEREKSNVQEEETILKEVGDKTKFLSPEDPISLSLEYYQIHLDTTDPNSDPRKQKNITDAKNSDLTAGQLNDSKKGELAKNSDSDSVKKNNCDKRYLSCLAGVTMRHLQKFIRMKFALTADHRVDIIYKGEVLQDSYSLMDVAYIFHWTKAKPMRFFYRIFTPMKVRPIKIVNTTLSTGGKQLQIVPVKPNSDKNVVEKMSQKEFDAEEEERKKKKEELMTQLQLQSKSKVVEGKKKDECVFDYHETDEEIKKFAENRDREWALQKKLDESKEDHHISKKRKKNKHSKNDLMHKKRKLHAEKINNDDDLLKLKVKLTNGHKHKHHRSLDKNFNQSELSNKEKLLQMRQVRHKAAIPEEKALKLPEKALKLPEKALKLPEKALKLPEKALKLPEKALKLPEKAIEKSELKVEISRLNNEAKNVATPVKKVENVKSTFIKDFQSFAEKYNKATTEKIVPKDVKTVNKSLDQKIANLKQRCTIEPKLTQITAQKVEKKVTFTEKTNVLSSGYPAGFTVSKIDQGVKRKADTEVKIDKRPSLEITLINPSPPTTPILQTVEKMAVKRPPPATIPLDRIKKSVNIKNTGLSIIPKLDKCDNIGALDLSNHKTKENGTSTKSEVKTVMQLSNLQMLSKVATEHKAVATTPQNKVKPQIPNLQTLKIPQMNAMLLKNAQKMPKLHEIKFRPQQNQQIRNFRPNQNQNIRNIPNPSLLIKQQNQRLNSFNNTTPSSNEKSEVKLSKPVVEAKICEKNEISV
ncbi:unnamed protein product [Brassicogethes aeneus]|uniref:RING-type domain-containing protein n=1 Tax=Brassicogethes aeneus TaxID=1431903 RepID=A0A9P0FB39_BRAAE|nr:unnamed protein product [Brassicogethes aeneus]